MQTKVPFCNTGIIPGPYCGNPGDGPHSDQNPFWYKFTCYKTGTLGFTITPMDLSDDYDWQVFDVTDRNPNDVFTDRSLYVTMNWSGESGVTGASSAGNSLDVCGGYGLPLFSKMAVIKEGHDYLLLISHFTTASQSGYKLEFGGGTAVIQDPNKPEVEHAGYHCGPIAVGVKLSRKVYCSSIAPDGTDFTFTIPGIKIVSAVGIGCTNAFDTDSLWLQLDKPLNPGTYTVKSKIGSDGNTLLGNCGNALNVDETATFEVKPSLPVPMGKVMALPCAPDEIQLLFDAPIRCASISNTGKDFVISGPSPVKIIEATGNCNASGLTTTVKLKLDQRILVAGDYTITLVKGDDGNTIENECHIPTAANQTAGFNIPIQPTVNLLNIAKVGCTPTSLKIGLSTPVRCSSIASNGSDFKITGPQAISILGATGNCNVNGLTDSITLQLSAPIMKGGNYIVELRKGTDNNTLISECWQSAQLPQQSAVQAADTVNAKFNYDISQDCKITTMTFSHDGRNNVNQWQWQFDDGETNSSQLFQKVYTTLGIKHFALKVSNGVCEAQTSIDTLLRSEVTAMFDVNPGPYCPMDVVIPVNQSLGSIKSYLWEYGNGSTSKAAKAMNMVYIPSQREQQYRIRLIVKNEVNCADTADRYITAVSSCYIDVPTAFSPNNDGQNDYLYPLNAYKAIDLQFSIYNREGNLLFKTTDWRNKWDGTVNGKPSDIGTYVWMLEYTESVSGKRIFRKGTTVLIR
ncbi:T9SS type B sorting domain-containing protein [Chitinophaga silvatica]|uniref:T9SS type B sorting domain-containing protein n=1 Tax=Chitinophaga silvatica TaxID=2282649 RepID=UPI0013146497|nr:gliding motility-associated C-terminal domain-containing protein [Chitinophaga silvatica]